MGKAEEIESASDKKNASTRVARVEGKDKQGRPRLLRVFYDDYEPGDDERGRDHIELPADPLKG